MTDFGAIAGGFVYYKAEDKIYMDKQLELEGVVLIWVAKSRIYRESGPFIYISCPNCL